MRPTGDVFCLTQFQNQDPELDPGLRPSPVSFPEPHGGGRDLPRSACGCRGCADLSGARRPAHGHACTCTYTPAVGLQLAGAAMRARWVWYTASAVRGGAGPPRSRARMAFEVSCSHKPAAILVYIASIAIAILNSRVFWDEDVLSAVFNRRRICRDTGPSWRSRHTSLSLRTH